MKSVSIFELKLSGASNGGNAISIPSGSSGAITLRRLDIVTNAGIGINALGSGPLEISQCVIEKNAGGGIVVQGSHRYDIANNFIIYNGSTSSLSGGLQLVANTASKLAFNTIALNTSSGVTFRGGVHCNGTMVSVANNIIYRNGEDDGAGSTKFDMTTQTGGSCAYATNVISALDAAHLGFKKAVGQPPYDFHLEPTAPATIVNAGGACTGRDIDNEVRPSGSGCELGADELKP